MVKKLIQILWKPDPFFEEIGEENFWQPFVFFIQVSGIIAIFTPIVNYLGWASTDHSAACSMNFFRGF